MTVTKEFIAAEMSKKGLIQFESDMVPQFEQVHVGDLLRVRGLFSHKSQSLESYTALCSGRLTKKSCYDDTRETTGPLLYNVRYDAALLLVVGHTVCSALADDVFEKARMTWNDRIVHGSAFYSAFMVITSTNSSWNLSDNEQPIQGQVFSLPWSQFVRGHDKITIERA